MILEPGKLVIFNITATYEYNNYVLLPAGFTISYRVTQTLPNETAVSVYTCRSTNYVKVHR